MMRPLALIIFLPFLALAVLWQFFFPGITAAGSMGLSGNWQYTMADGDESDLARTFSQYYSTNIQHRMTDAMDFSGYVSYSRNWSEAGGLSDLVSPSLSLNTVNDIFQLNLSGYDSEANSATGVRSSYRSWASSLGSRWQKRLWPDLRLWFGQTWGSNDLATTSSGAVDNGADNYGLSVAWNLIHALTYYSYSVSDSSDNIGRTDAKSTSHSAHLESNKQFLDDRASLAFAQNYSNLSYESTTNGNSAMVPLSSPVPATRGGVGLAVVDVTVDWAALTDPFPAPNLANVYNLALNTDRQEVDLIYVYTSVDLTAVAATINWSLYSNSSINGDANWDPEAAIAPSYNTVLKRFEITVPALQKRYLMLVITLPWPGGTPAFTFDRVAAFNNITSTENNVYYKTSSISYSTDVSLGYDISSEMNISYGFGFDKSMYTAGNDTDQISHAAGLSWNPNRQLSTNFNVSQAWTDSGDSKSSSRSYALGAAYSPINTLSFSSGITRNESYQDEEITATGHSFSLNTVAALYKDLDARLDLGYNMSENEQNNSSSDSYNSTLILVSRLSPKLTMDFTESYNMTTSSDTSNGGDGETQSGSTSFSLSWRPSDMMSGRTSAYYSWAEGSDATTGLNLSLGLTVSRKAQLSMGYSLSQSTEISHSFSLGWNWNISRVLSMSANGGYTITDGVAQWNMFTRLSANFR